MTFWIITIVALACVLTAAWLSDHRRRRRGADVAISDTEARHDARSRVAKVIGPRFYRR